MMAPTEDSPVTYNFSKTSPLFKVKQLFGMSKKPTDSERHLKVQDKHMSKKVHKSQKTFQDLYVANKQLGTGSYSVVKHVTNRKSGKSYAAKIIDKHKLSKTDQLALQHEVKILSAIEHPYITDLHKVIEDTSTCYIITELMCDGDLFDRVIKQKKLHGKEVQRIMYCLAEAVCFCHSKNIVHRDVKPENVLLDGERVKLCDFGFAKQLDRSSDPMTETCGTPGYAAPELLCGKPYGKKVDIFSLGVVTYILICGYPPFPMKLSKLRKKQHVLSFPSKDWKSVDEETKKLIKWMLAPRPEDRPTARELLESPWIHEGKVIMDASTKRATKERLESEKIQRRAMTNYLKDSLNFGIEVIKYGRNGSPHPTKIILLPNGKLSWQSKSVKKKIDNLNAFRRFTKKQESISSETIGSNTKSFDNVKCSSPTASKEYTFPRSFHGGTFQSDSIKSFILLSEITDIVVGHQTKVFDRYIGSCDESLCFSLITPARSLDLQLYDRDQRDFLVSIFAELVQKSKIFNPISANTA